MKKLSKVKKNEFSRNLKKKENIICTYFHLNK